MPHSLWLLSIILKKNLKKMLNEEHADTKYPFITYVEFCLCTDNVNNVCDNRDERQKEKRQNHG